jgi:hypothetical protein
VDAVASVGWRFLIEISVTIASSPRMYRARALPREPQHLSLNETAPCSGGSHLLGKLGKSWRYVRLCVATASLLLLFAGAWLSGRQLFCKHFDMLYSVRSNVQPFNVNASSQICLGKNFGTPGVPRCEESKLRPTVCAPGISCCLLGRRNGWGRLESPQ